MSKPNPVAKHMRHSGAGTHGKSKKALRQQDRVRLNKELREPRLGGVSAFWGLLFAVAMAALAIAAARWR